MGTLIQAVGSLGVGGEGGRRNYHPHDYHPLQVRSAISLATWEQRRDNIAQTIDVLPDFRAEVCEGWSGYFESTYGTSESVEDSSAVHDTDLSRGETHVSVH